MKPCFGNRKWIALLAMNSLEPERDRELRIHLNTCAGCRRYLEEMTSVTKKVRAAVPEAAGEPSDSFHRNVMEAVGRVKSEPAGFTVLARFRAAWEEHWAVASATAAVLAIAAWFFFAPRNRLAPVAPVAVDNNTALPSPMLNLQPTLANYEAAVSMDKLDELLTRQGDRTTEALPIYTARISGSKVAD